MNHDTNEFECDICHARTLHSRRSDERVPEGWWSLQCTRNFQSMFVRDICARCWELLFMQIFPQTRPLAKPPAARVANPGRDLVIGLTPKF
jgi:hypothetical protein